MKFSLWLSLYLTGFCLFTSCPRTETKPTETTPPAEVKDAGIESIATEVQLFNPSLHNTLLGRPTDKSIAISVLADSPGDAAKIEFGTALTENLQSILLPQMSGIVSTATGAPLEIELTGLLPDTQYFYRLHYIPKGQAEQREGIHSFHTQRAKGHSFRFGVQGDTHPERYKNKMFHDELFKLTMEQVRDRQPDLYFTLGDDFSIEKIIKNFKKANYPANHTFQKNVEGFDVPPENWTS